MSPNLDHEIRGAAEPARGASLDARWFAASLDQPRGASAPSKGLVRTSGVSHCVLGHRIERGPGRADDGVFASWSWDGTTLTASNDRYGMHPLYFCALPDAIWISPSIVGLLRAGVPAELDTDALCVFLHLGFYLGDDTPFRHIKALPANARLTWRRGELRLEGGPAVRPADRLDRRAAIDGYVDAFRAAMRRRLPEHDDFAIPLSGGRDSRHILLELCEQGRKPKLCVTTRHYPPRSDEDARVATLVAAACGVPHVVVEQTDRFDAERRKNVLTGFCSDEHAWALTLSNFLAGRARSAFDGLAGDVLSAGLFLTVRRQRLCEAGRFAELAELLLFPKSDWTLPLFFRPDVGGRAARERAVARVAAELERHAGAANPIGSFYFWSRTRRAICLVPYGLLGHLERVDTPYLDHDLYDFLAAIPARVLLDQQFHTDAIRRAYPRYRDVPFEDKTVVADAWAARHRFLETLVAYARRPAGPPALTRMPRRLSELASLAHRLFDLHKRVRPQVLLYAMQLERLAAGDADA